MSQFDLARFHDAQDAHGAFAEALDELRSGRKRTHWMWFVFPQLADLGSSTTARYFGIVSLDHARAYLADPVLHDRLVEAALAASEAPATSAPALLGSLDAVKLRSSMTLFALAAPDEPAFRGVLDRWYGGQEDDATLRLLGRSPHADG